MMSKQKEPTYEQLRKHFSDEEIAEDFVLRSSLSKAEREQAEIEFRKARMQSLQAMSDKQVLQSELVRMRILMKDYFQQKVYLPAFSFGQQLKKYLKLLQTTQTQFAKDIHVHKARLSRLINEKEHPNIDLMYRLEIHSSAMIPATYWYKLHSRKIEEEIRSDQEKRAVESKKVQNELTFKRSA